MKKVCIAVVTLVSVVIIATTSVGRTDVNISVPETNKYTNISDNTESSTEVMTTAVKKSKEVAKKKKQKSSKKTNTYSDDDLYCLAAVVYMEAGAEPEYVQKLVANVVVNRVHSGLYPNTIRKVATQRYQYGMMWKNGVKFPKNADKKAVAQCYSVAKDILGGERVCPDNVLFQAEFEQGSGVYKEVSGIYFCYK